MISIQKLELNIRHQDPRKRKDALTIYNSNGTDLDFSLYPEFCEALKDDNERCRLLVIPLIVAMSKKYTDCLVFVPGSSEQIRLEDDAFIKLCACLTDPSVEVKALAAKALSEYRSVNLNILMTTLDKKTPVSYSGAFVYGLEDESMNVRMASLDAMCQLSKVQPIFAQKSIDSIVDMFNDEIEDIRLKAIQCLGEIKNIALRDDQIDIILTVLDSPSMDIREALYEMIAGSPIATPLSIKKCIEGILCNLTKFPQDRLSIFKCFKTVGQTHAEFVKLLIDELLAVHPYLKLPEHSLIDQNYIASLILVFNAAHKLPEIKNLLEEHTQQHYTYICDTQPNFVPETDSQIRSQSDAPTMFFLSIFDRLRTMLCPFETKFAPMDVEPLKMTNGSSDDCKKNALVEFKEAKVKSRITSDARNSILTASINDLRKFGSIESKFKASTEFYSCFIECILSLSKILDSKDWMHSYSPFKSNSRLFLSTIQRVLYQTLELLHKYHKLTRLQHCCILQLRLQTLAVKLIAFITSSNASALDLSDEFLEEHRNLRQFLIENPDLDSRTINQLSASIFKELDSLDNPRPGTIARNIGPFFTKLPDVLEHYSDLLMLLVESQNIDELRQMQMSSACFLNEEQLEKGGDLVFRFTAGLVLALTIDAKIENIKSTDVIAIKVVYPDKQAQITVPISSHFRLVSTDRVSETSTYRLYSVLNLSHGKWSEPCSVKVSFIIDLRDNKSSSIDLTTLQATSVCGGGGGLGGGLGQSAVCQIIELGKPISIKMHPK